MAGEWRKYIKNTTIGKHPQLCSVKIRKIHKGGWAFPNTISNRLIRSISNPIDFEQDLKIRWYWTTTASKNGEPNVTINQTPALRRLSSLQSIWQLEGSVFPPACQGVMWSASISSISKYLPHTGQIPFWRSYAERF